MVKHVLGVSGGKDSAALAIYMRSKYPELDVDFYMSDTGNELKETIELVERMEAHLGKEIRMLNAVNADDPFKHFLKLYRGYLPSSQARWCTKKLKLEPFEAGIGDEPTISYVGIRGDEDREGYVSVKPNIQSIFPFRKNIWSVDVINKVLNNDNLELLVSLYSSFAEESIKAEVLDVARTPISREFYYSKKMNTLMDFSVPLFNKVVFHFLKTTDYPVGKLESFPLIDNEEVITRDDVFKILEDSGVGVPGYYKEVEFEVEGKKGTYSRSRSGCFFCFYQQTIEWVWLYEQHPDLFKRAMEYEKDGYTWRDNESLADLIKPERIKKIKEEYLKRKERNLQKSKSSPYLVDSLFEGEENMCVNCFI